MQAFADKLAKGKAGLKKYGRRQAEKGEFHGGWRGIGSTGVFFVPLGGGIRIGVPCGSWGIKGACVAALSYCDPP